MQDLCNYARISGDLGHHPPPAEVGSSNKPRQFRFLNGWVFSLHGQEGHEVQFPGRFSEQDQDICPGLDCYSFQCPGSNIASRVKVGQAIVSVPEATTLIVVQAIES